MENQEIVKVANVKVNFTVIGNNIIQDERLSIESRFILIYLRHLPSDWVCNKSDIQKRLKIGRRIVDRCFEELHKVGYLVQVDMVQSGSLFTTKGYLAYPYSIYEEPITLYSTDVQNVQRQTESPITKELSDVQNVQRSDSTDVQNVQLLNTNNINNIYTTNPSSNSFPTNQGNENQDEHSRGGGGEPEAAPKKFVKPTIAEIAEFVSTKYPQASKTSVESFAERFWSHYENKDWSYGKKQKMKHWKLALPQWKETIQKELLNESSPFMGKLNATIQTTKPNLKFNIK